MSLRNISCAWALIGFVAVWGNVNLYSAEPPEVEPVVPAVVYLFSYFTGNGESGLHLAWSTDGLRWEALAGGKPLLAPQVGSRLMRDPYVVRGSDGTFYLLWTTGWKDRGFGLAHSPDLVHWSPQRYIPVMEGIPGAKNCWAPEMIWDSETEQWVLFWSSTMEGRFPETLPAGDNGWNHRIYRTTSKDLQAFGPVELFYEPGFNVIDATIAPWQGKYVMVIKNETRHPPAKNLCVAFAEKVLGPWSAPSSPISPPGIWAEGPSILQVENTYYIYYDRYTMGQYGILRTKDFEKFEDITAQLQYSAGMRHGTAFAVSREIFRTLKAHCDRLATKPSP
jgi:beta-xylosidase